MPVKADSSSAGVSVLSKVNPLTQLSHIMQGAEANILRASMQMVPNIVLLAHDGFIAKNEVDLPSLQEHVAQITGHCVTFTQFQL